MSVNAHRITRSKLEIDSTNYASVEANVFLED